MHITRTTAYDPVVLCSILFKGKRTYFAASNNQRVYFSSVLFQLDLSLVAVPPYYRMQDCHVNSNLVSVVRLLL